ncbi:MAG: phosphodiester glycosidase family protein [Muribaculaceae bacterium]|nr:phosphodiester glycosidase family protein [Muribaculaceae bacterium]
MKNIILTGVFASLAVLGINAETMTVGGKSLEVNRTETQLAPGVKYTHLAFPGHTYTSYSGGGSVHVVEADLTNPTVAVRMVNNGALSGTKSLTNHAAAIPASEGKAVAGANANFWITTETPWKAQMSGMPWGITVRDGVMYTDPNAKNAAHCGGPNRTGMLAIDENGRCIIDRLLPQATDITASGFNFSVYHPRIDHYLDIDMCNRIVYPGSASIYTRVYGTSKAFKPVDASTHAITGGDAVEVICDLAEGENLTVGGETRLVIKEVRTSVGTGTLGDHDVAIVGRDSYASVMQANYKVGDEIVLNIKMNFEQGVTPVIKQAVSGNILAMKDGVQNSAELKNETYNSGYNERTIYATNAAGDKLWIITCEHNVMQTKKYLGFSCSALCDIATIFGATEATQVDCGGSAQMYAGSRQVSKSYDGSGVRNVYDGIFITSTAPASELKEVPEEEAPKADTVDPALAGVEGPASYDFDIAYADTEIAELAGKTVKRVLAKGDVLYILAFDSAKAPYVYVYNHKQNTMLRSLDCSTCICNNANAIESENNMPLSDIALTSDGYLVGTARDISVLGKHFVLMYKWNNDSDGYATGVAGHWNISGQGGNWNNNDIGETMMYVGSSVSGYIYYSSASHGATGIRWSRVHVNSNGQLDTPTYNLAPAGFEGTTQIGTPQIWAAPWNTEMIVLAGTNIQPQAVNYVGSVRGQSTISSSATLIPKGTTHVTTLTHKGTHYMVSAGATGFTLLQVNSGLGTAKNITVNAEALPNYSGSDVFGTATTSDNNLVLLALRGGKLSKYGPKGTTVDPIDPIDPVDPVIYGDRAHTAYQLELEGEKETGWKFHYVLTGDVKKATIHLVPTTSREALQFEGTTQKGSNTVEISKDELAVGEKYNWYVEIQSYPVEETKKVHSHTPHATADARGGVGVVTNPESDAYGFIVTSAGYAQGFYMYSPEHEYVANYHKGTSPWTATNRSDLFRIGMRDGKMAYATCFSDKGAGFWSFDPENPEAAPANLSAGTNDGKGTIKLGDAITGSGGTDIAFTGTGTNTKVWHFAEDYPSGNHANKGTLVYWNIGEDDQITTHVAKDFAAQKLTGISMLANQNTALTPYGDGVFVSQARTSGNQTASVPGLMYVDAEDGILYNAGGDPDIPSCGGGVALSADGSRIVVSGCKLNARLYNVTWNGKTPSLSFVQEIPGSANTGSNEVCQMAFDTAGNVLAINRTTVLANDGLQVFAIAGEQAPVTVPAKAAYVVEGPAEQVGVETVSVEDSKASVEWYNLQGVRVSPDNLAPGIYIRRQGKATKKVYIR